ncbi:MAG: hypothetical protein MJ072_00480, partial [Clostridia bacterium]|nr:hypothetical protein [Clostridia bacterium]
ECVNYNLEDTFVPLTVEKTELPSNYVTVYDFTPFTVPYLTDVTTEIAGRIAGVPSDFVYQYNIYSATGERQLFFSSLNAGEYSVVFKGFSSKNYYYEGSVETGFAIAKISLPDNAKNAFSFSTEINTTDNLGAFISGKISELKRDHKATFDGELYKGSELTSVDQVVFLEKTVSGDYTYKFKNLVFTNYDFTGDLSFSVKVSKINIPSATEGSLRDLLTNSYWYTLPVQTVQAYAQAIFNQVNMVKSMYDPTIRFTSITLRCKAGEYEVEKYHTYTITEESLNDTTVIDTSSLVITFNGVKSDIYYLLDYYSYAKD